MPQLAANRKALDFTTLNGVLAALGNFTYKARSGTTFTLQTRPMSFTDAQRSCQANGGQLASLASQQEQADLEAFFMLSGYLLPTFHKHYWLGMSTASMQTWPNFTWQDGSRISYSNWGR